MNYECFIYSCTIMPPNTIFFVSIPVRENIIVPSLIQYITLFLLRANFFYRMYLSAVLSCPHMIPVSVQRVSSLIANIGLSPALYGVYTICYYTHVLLYPSMLATAEDRH